MNKMDTWRQRKISGKDLHTGQGEMGQVRIRMAQGWKQLKGNSVTQKINLTMEQYKRTLFLSVLMK